MFKEIYLRIYFGGDPPAAAAGVGGGLGTSLGVLKYITSSISLTASSPYIFASSTASQILFSVTRSRSRPKQTGSETLKKTTNV